jgi:hypothetical protein
MLQDIDGHNLVYTRWAYNVDDKLLPYVNSVPWSLINVLHTPYFVNIMAGHVGIDEPLIE